MNFNSNSQPQQGFLERTGIQVETLIPEDILKPEIAQGVRFRAIKPKGAVRAVGYAFTEVDDFLSEILIPSLEWYKDALHSRDKNIHFLGEEIDKLFTENANLNNQIQYTAYNGALSEGLEAAEGDKETLELVQKVAQQQDKIETLQLEIASLKSSSGGVNIAGGLPVPIPVQSNNAELEAKINELSQSLIERETYIQELYPKYTQLLEAYTALEEAKSNESDTTDLVAEKDAVILSLQTQVQNDTQRVEAQIVNLQNAISNLENEKSQLANEKSQLTQEKIQLNNEKAQLTQEKSQLANENTQLSQELSQVKTNLIAIQTSTQDNAELNNKIVEQANYIEQFEAQYKMLETKYTDDTTFLQNTLDEQAVILQGKQSELEEATKLAENAETGVSTASLALAGKDDEIAKLTEYATAAGNQYTELYERYNTDTATLQEQITMLKASGGATNSSGEISQELQDYIDEITNRYNEARELVASLQLENVNLKNDMESNDLVDSYKTEIGELKVQLEAEKARSHRLEVDLAEYIQIEEEETQLPEIPLLNEGGNNQPKNVNGINLQNLPKGIRLEDL